MLFPVLWFAWNHVLTRGSPMGRKLKSELREHGGPLIRVRRADLAAAGVERVTERVAGVLDGKPQLEGGRVLDVTNVVWCTGFRNDYSWIRPAPEQDEDGYPDQERGAARGSPGLYFVGFPFLHSFSSMLILGAGRDGERVANQIAARARSRGRGARRTPRAAAGRVAARPGE